MNILITGHEGFIGKNLTRWLKQKHNVSGMDIKSCGDVRELDECLEMTRGIDCIVHLAALPGVPQSFEKPLQTFRTNVIGTANIVEAAIANEVPKIILASSGAADNRGSSPYAMSKWLAEYIVQLSQIGSVVLRLSNVYGPYSEHKMSLVHVAMRALMNGCNIDVYGDGSHSRDFIHVSDVCRAIELAILSNDKYTNPIDIGTGKATSVMDVLSELVVVANKHIEINYQPERDEQIRAVANTERAFRELGFRAGISLRDGLRATWEACQ